MKHFLRVLLLTIISAGFAFAQQANIKIEPVSPHFLTTSGLDTVTNCVSTGLKIVANENYIYFSAENIASENQPITNTDFTLTSVPTGSNAQIETWNNWVYFKADVKGAYDVKLTITTASGSDDTTITVYSSDYIGVGNFEGIAGTTPNCYMCHGSSFQPIFDSWKTSGHANIFNESITTNDHYSTDCMTCHTTGYDKYNAASNNGFDDVAVALGWDWNDWAPAKAGNWDSLKTKFPNLVNFATIGCEMCHGAGSEHATKVNKNMIQISLRAGNCAQCHDEPWRHNKSAQYDNSLHSEAVFSTSFASNSSQDNSLDDCIRCHDGTGFVNFTKDKTTDATLITEADHIPITCATCHDPHGNNNVASTRSTPAGSDTLGNGLSYTNMGGTGQLCMNCHKSRRNANLYSATAVTSSHWGPHHSTQADVFLGENAATFGSDTVYQSSSHKYAVTNGCVDCHMTATVDTGNVNRDLVGGHTWMLNNPATGFDLTSACEGCHGPKNSFDDFVATVDYDLNGKLEPIQTEIRHLLTMLSTQLPPVGLDSIDYVLINDGNDLNVKKAYYNYQLVHNEGSFGLHNTKFSVDVLYKSIVAAGGVIPVELTSFTASLINDKVNLKWTTVTETNNKGFIVERKTFNNWESIGFVQGKGTYTGLSNYQFTDELKDVSTNSAIYRLKQIDYNGSYKYSNEVKLTLEVVPKEFTLSQNYPNPFNPATTIKYSLPYNSNVRISIYNITGEIVKTLVNGTQNAGNYEVIFNTHNNTELSSGIYFYSIQATSKEGANSFTQTKKMILLK